jgi:deglycase
MPKVLILTDDAAESLEVMYPYQRLLEEGYEVEISVPSKKKLQFIVHDFVDGYDTYTEKPGYTWDADLAFSEVDPSAYAAVVIPGGRAPEYIRNSPDFPRIIDVDGAGIVDGVMVSARAWPDHPAWMREFVRLLRERAPVEEREAVTV